MHTKRQRQQVCALQIRALGALCRLLSQVWRGRIALSIPRLQKVWRECAANLFCGELEEEGCFGVSIPHFHLLWYVYPVTGMFFCFVFCTNSEVILNTYVRVQTLIQTWLRVTSNQQPNTSRSTEKKHTRTHTVQPAESKHQDKERVRALAQELLILGELARPTASKCIAYGVPFSQLSQRQHEKCYISLSRSKKKTKFQICWICWI